MLSLLVVAMMSGISSPLQAVDGRHQAWATAGFSSTWALQVGGGFRVVKGWRLDLQLDTPAVRPLALGGRFALGASYLRPLGEVWGIGLRGELGAPWASDFAGSWLGLDLRLGAQPGVYRPRWSLAADLSVLPVLGVSWAPSNVVRDSFGDRPGSALQAPRAVGLLFPALRFDLGLNARVLLGGDRGLRWWLTGNVSWVVTPTQIPLSTPPTSTLPFTSTLGVLCEL